MATGLLLAAGTLLLLLSPIVSQTLLDKRCRTVNPGSNCYLLYQAETTVTWDDAYDRCRQSDNRRLAIVDSDDDDSLVTDIMSRLTPDGAGAWVSGRRSEVNTWYYLKSGAVEMLNGIFPSDKYCSTLHVASHLTRSSSCTVAYRGICQYADSSSDSEEDTKPCPLARGDDCYTITDTVMTWFEARNYCRTQYGGDLASTMLSRTEMDNLKARDTVWIGLERRPWLWTSPSGNRTITRYSFGDNQGSDAVQSCLSLRTNTQNGVPQSSWADESCSEPLKYFISQSDTEEGVVGDGSRSPAGAGPVLPSEAPQQNTVAIAASITMVGVASILFSLIFLYVRRRRIEKAHQRRTRSISREFQAPSPSSSPSLTRDRAEPRDDRPRISAPIAMEAPYPTSGYGKLGPLIPVAGQIEGESEYSEIPSDSQPIPSVYGMLGSVAPYATTVQFSESSPYVDVIDTRHDVEAENGDAYAMPHKPDIENMLIENLMYHKKMQQAGNH